MIPKGSPCLFVHRVFITFAAVDVYVLLAYLFLYVHRVFITFAAGDVYVLLAYLFLYRIVLLE